MITKWLFDALNRLEFLRNGRINSSPMATWLMISDDLTAKCRWNSPMRNLAI